MVNQEQYQKLVGKLIYLTHTCSNIAFVVSMISYIHQAQNTLMLLIKYLGTIWKGFLEEVCCLINMDIYKLKPTPI